MSSEPPNPKPKSFFDRLAAAFHEEEVEDRGRLLSLMRDAQSHNVMDKETLSMMVMSFTAFGMMKGTPALNFISAFVLLSFYINRPRTVSWFSQSLVSLAMIFFSCGVLYWRLMKGYLPAK